MPPLEIRLAELASLSPAQLRFRWKSELGSPPPPGFGPDLLRRGLADRLQRRGTGALPMTVAREIKRGVAELSAGTLGRSRSATLRPGARLAREWHGKTHHVLVTENVFEYRDRRYRSLTAIAREITGANWSGPRFFGLTALRTGGSDTGQ